MVKVAPVLSAAFALLVATGAASAQTAPSDSIKHLIDTGFEIRSVTVVPVEMLTALGRKADAPPEVLITLQTGHAIAVCEMQIGNWNLQTPSSMTNTGLCSVTSDSVGTVPAASATPSNQAPASGGSNTNQAPADQGSGSDQGAGGGADTGTGDTQSNGSHSGRPKS